MSGGKAPEFVEKKFHRSKSLHTRRYYEAGIRRVPAVRRREKKISEVDDEKDAASLLVSRCLADAPISQGAVFANAEAQ